MSVTWKLPFDSEHQIRALCPQRTLDPNYPGLLRVQYGPLGAALVCHHYFIFELKLSLRESGLLAQLQVTSYILHTHIAADVGRLSEHALPLYKFTQFRHTNCIYPLYTFRCLLIGV